MANIKDTRINASSSLKLPAGSTAQRPSSPGLGMLRFNTDNAEIEVYNGTDWVTVALGAAGLYAFTSATFTNGSSYGRSGPSLTQARNGLSGPETSNWKFDTSFFNTDNGFQRWVVPQDGTYRIEARGATGAASTSGNGGEGAKIRVDKDLTGSQAITILVGQPGRRSSAHGGGGGGTFVVEGTGGFSESDIIVIAGGGGGRRTSASGNGIPGNYGQFGTGTNLERGLINGSNSSSSRSGVTIHTGSQSGYTPTTPQGLGQGGVSANSCFGNGGGGFFGNGVTDSRSGGQGGDSFTNGGLGGSDSSGAEGGFGGGGAGQGCNGGGGGGGYTGGAGGFTAAGGGSYVAPDATNIVYSTDNNDSPGGANIDSSFYSGFVSITKL